MMNQIKGLCYDMLLEILEEAERNQNGQGAVGVAINK